MDEKTLLVLEYPKVLEKLAGYCAFAGSAELARQTRPSTDMEQVRRKLGETSEGLRLLSTRPDLTIGGVRDVRAAVDLARHGGVLTPADLLDIKSTLVASRTLVRTFERLNEQFPLLCEIVNRIPPPSGIIDAITRAISDRGDVLDSASPKLGTIRREMRIAHDRLMSRLQRIVGDPKNAPLLQEALITQRDGRYVIPLRSEFKGRIKSVIHDQSASGATLFVEPLAVVEANNLYREMLLAERDEERRILTDLSRQVGLQAEDMDQTVNTIAELDFSFARSKYAFDTAATEPVLHLIRGRRNSKHPGSLIRLYQARHPLLDPTSVVSIDVDLDEQTYALIITGPNTGGKTVTLKTVGLLALMAQSGMHIPAHTGSEISLFESIYADIGDEQSIEQSLSTFSGHITNIIHILQAADSRSLVILDELGAGTDPQEGAALAGSILTHLLDRSITTLVTTHHPELKAYAHATPGVVNASVEFDLETLGPTYHLMIGLPGRSNALAIAQRLGMPDSIITLARSELNPNDLRADDLLNEIHQQRNHARQARAAADRARHEAETIRIDLTRRLEKIEDERRSILERARQEAESQVQQIEDELRQARRALVRARQPLDALQVVEEAVADLEEGVEKPTERQMVYTGEPNAYRAIRLGDKVRVLTINAQGVVTGLGEEDAEVQVGMLRIRARMAELVPWTATLEENLSASRARKRSKETVETKPKVDFPLPASPGIELDVRGQRADDALDAMERYLDSAYLAGLPFVRIIHGKGTGKLRQSVRETLSHHPHVKSFESGGDKEGGEGVTVAKLKI